MPRDTRLGFRAHLGPVWIPLVELCIDQGADVHSVDGDVLKLAVYIDIAELDAAHHDTAQIDSTKPSTAEVDIAQLGAAEINSLEQ